MNLGQDILTAVQRGGLNNWPTTAPRYLLTGKNRAKTTIRLSATQAAMDKVLNAVKGRMTVDAIAKAAGMKHSCAYTYVVKLLAEGKLVRSQNRQPHLYWRATHDTGR